jgi:DNA-binding response OmpR family regulator
MPLLLAEDDPKISKLLVHLLSKDGYQIDHAVDGAQALMYAEMNDYEVIILDWMMPLVSGDQVCITLRERKYAGGILMLTAKDTLEDKIRGLEYGADDYLVKPFEYRELLARIKALERRSSKAIKSDILKLGRFSMDRAKQVVFSDGELLNLSKREFQLFSLLLENSGNIVPRDTLIDRVWGIDGDISQNNLDAFIRLLRKKVEVEGKARTIINVRGIGYKIEV